MQITTNTILITGGSSGIGLALAKRFLSLNNTVIITGRDEKKLTQLKNEIPNLITFAGDLTNEASFNALVLFIKEHYPTLNVLINNAAVQYNYHFLDEKDALQKIENEIAINLSVPIKLTTSLLPLLLQNKNGAVINVSSGLFIAPKKSASVYCATKSAIHSFTKTLRYQLESTDIKVFELIPALVDTPMTAGRGKSKITAEQLVDEFIKDLKNNRYESYIGKTKLLKFINRISPKLADKIMKNGL